MCCFLALVACAGLADGGTQLPPELETREARSDYGMVATGSPEATMAGVEILERGGNAVDAAVAAALVLGVSDSDASGIGGMTYMLVRFADGRTVAIDGSARAPMTVDMAKLREMKREGRNYGYETVATPTTLATLEHARSRFGTMPLAELLRPAIEVAEKGYRLSEVQITWTRKYYDNILAASVFMPFLAMVDGRTIGEAGDLHCQPQLAMTLRRIAAGGARSFYLGPIADEIEADMVANGGFLRKVDLALTRVREVPPLRETYRGLEVLTFPPPGGGATVAAALNLLETFPGRFLAQDTIARHQTLIEAFRIAAADGAAAGAPVGVGWMGGEGSGKEDARRRAAMIQPGEIISRAELWPRLDPECQKEGESTTHVSVADQFGNVVALTQTLSRSFGAKVATPGLGFCYNSLLESFNVDKPQCPGYLQPRQVCSNDMAPTIVLENGRLLAAFGTPGSSRIASITATIVSNLVDREMGLAEAVAAPRILWGGTNNRRVSIEVVEPFTEDDVAALEATGYEGMTALRFPAPADDTAVNFGGVNIVGYDASVGAYVGVVDPRRGGLAEGPRVVAPR
ncbi:MAG TPA: gamma-glutamyltransferase [Chondromyces sp.]|nr:gamma-glutamyltransferase [Chondromyces sp.]